MKWWVSSSEQVHAVRFGTQAQIQLRQCFGTINMSSCAASARPVEWLAGISFWGRSGDSTALQWWWGLAGLLKHTAAWDGHCRFSPLCLPHQCIALVCTEIKQEILSSALAHLVDPAGQPQSCPCLNHHHGRLDLQYIRRHKGSQARHSSAHKEFDISSTA